MLERYKAIRGEPHTMFSRQGDDRSTWTWVPDLGQHSADYAGNNVIATIPIETPTTLAARIDRGHAEYRAAADPAAGNAKKLGTLRVRGSIKMSKKA
jgi:hypothetical protein